jgi:hypothetical protein
VFKAGEYFLFAGHYVVICGYDADACEFEIRDPASSRYCNLYCLVFLGDMKFSAYTLYVGRNNLRFSKVWI